MRDQRRYAGAYGRQLYLLWPEREPNLACGRGGLLMQRQPAQGAVRVHAVRQSVQEDGCASQARDPRASGLPINDIRPCALHDASALHHRHQVGHGKRFAGVVRDEHGSGTRAAQHIDDVLAHRAAQIQVQRIERFIQQYQIGAGRQRPGQRDALLLAARKFVGIAFIQAG